jgi:hypothetical protein
MERAELYGALAAAMVRDMARFAAPPFAQPPEPAVPEAGALLRCWSYPVFAFIAARDLLWRFGLAEALDQAGSVTTDDTALFRSYRLAIDGSEVAAFVTQRASSGFGLPPIDEVLAAWLACAAHFKRASTARAPFVPHDDLHEVMQELVRSGYATRENGRFHWTGKIAPAMDLYRGTDPALYGAVAAEIVRCSVDAWMFPKPPRTVPSGTAEPLRAVAGSRFSDHALSTFRHAGQLLVELGVAQSVDWQDGKPVTDRYTGHFAMTIDGDKVAPWVAERVASRQFDMPPLGEVMAVWLNCAVLYSGGIDEEREPFDAGDDVQELMHALALAGYATWRGKRFLWTDKIGHAMQTAICWDDRNRSFAEVGRLQVEEELRKAARSIPEDVRIAVLKSDVQAVREALLHRWSDDAWGPEADPTDWQRRLATVANARRLMAFVTDRAKG